MLFYGKIYRILLYKQKPLFSQRFFNSRNMNQEMIALMMLVKTAMPLVGSEEPIISPIPANKIVGENALQTEVLALKSLDLEKRHPNENVNQAFADNILLSLHYLKGDIDSFKKDKEKVGPENIVWEKARGPFEAVFVLKSGDSFAFHENVREEYKDKPLITINSHFAYQEGYKAVAGLFGNGVCHLASLINWTASEAGLAVTSPVGHDFYPIPEVPQEYGTSILYWQGQDRNSCNQNLYLKNNLDVPLVFTFNVDEKEVNLKVERMIFSQKEPVPL